MRLGPIQDVGLGLRPQHYDTILTQRPPVPWFEVLTDNYLGHRARPHHHLTQVRADYPITAHGVGLSLGGSAPLDKDYLEELKHFIHYYEPAWVSEHLCWCVHDGHYIPDLLPMPYTQEAVTHCAARIQHVQEVLQQRIVIENVSSYMRFAEDEMPEWAFLKAVVALADCDILLDVNNIYVSAQNHQFNAWDYISALPPARIKEIHLAGYTDMGTHLLDTHGAPVQADVWDLYVRTLGLIGSRPTLIEWDNNIPVFETLWAEAQKAQQHMQRVSDAAA